MGATLQDHDASERGDHHEGSRPLRRFFVPPRQGGVRGVNMDTHRPLHQTPEQQSQQQDEAQGLDTFRLLQKETIDNHRIFEKSVVLLRPMLVFVACKDTAGAMGHVTRSGYIGEEYEAARFFLAAGNALALDTHGSLQPIA